ncbi:Clp protease N-terminal domain-containing protein [Streptomyces violaceochromogenes]|uniref:Clp protease N-terminal domain-containing protein n=1 Tax=Streptomyces violaceochromogenes TaxID=67377 RepID=A0ABU6LVA9_9ACTN|nr:Clp protease N-terminal domain-containing protein [Streptomyces violaceochromogenes]MEC7052552.1 Clp protease N-terminal domain-containing protein [Streptomyces violaceochromogenes]GHC79385.1 peptidase [Streptomyces violaceochromogenes]
MTRGRGADGVEDVRPLISRQSAHEHGIQRVDNDARLSDELASVVGGARRRAVRDGDRQIDTAHLLHSLLESDPEARSVFGEGPQIARLLGYLVQRSIGYGLRWQSGVEDSGAVPVVTETAGYSPLAAGCMEYARERAAGRGGPARGTDLLAAIVADPQARAVEVLERAGIDPREVFARLDDRYGLTGECGEAAL